MQYRVRTLAVQGRRKKIYRLNDIVTDENFPPGNAELLVASGHLERVEEVAETDEVLDTTPNDPETLDNTVSVETETESTPEVVEVTEPILERVEEVVVEPVVEKTFPPIEEMNFNKMIKALKKSGKEFAGVDLNNITKEQLYELYIQL